MYIYIYKLYIYIYIKRERERERERMYRQVAMVRNVLRRGAASWGGFCALKGAAKAAVPGSGAKDHTPEITKVTFHWKLPLEIQWKFPQTYHWESDSPFENTADKCNSVGKWNGLANS